MRVQFGVHRRIAALSCVEDVSCIPFNVLLRTFHEREQIVSEATRSGQILDAIHRKRLLARCQLTKVIIVCRHSSFKDKVVPDSGGKEFAQMLTLNLEMNK